MWKAKKHNAQPKERIRSGLGMQMNNSGGVEMENGKTDQLSAQSQNKRCFVLGIAKIEDERVGSCTSPARSIVEQRLKFVSLKLANKWENIATEDQRHMERQNSWDMQNESNLTN